MAIPFADAIFWVAVVSCLVAQIAILRSVLRMRGEMPANGVPKPRTGVEIAWVIVPAIALTAVLVLTWRTIHRTSAGPAVPTSSAARIANEAPALPTSSASPTQAGSASSAGGSTP